MIGKITGTLDFRGTDHVLIDVGGVGYIVHCSDRTLMAMPGRGERVSLYTELLVREDLLQLFGFTTLLEKEWHRLLLSVQGIGAKAAMAILGTLGPEGVGRAIALQDWAAVKAAPGVGPKIAQRVVNELKDKAPTVMAMGADLGSVLEGVPADDGPDAPARSDAPVAKAKAAGSSAGASRAAAQADALSALLNLGYGQGDAASAVARAAAETPEGETPDEAALIRAALKLLAPKG